MEKSKQPLKYGIDKSVAVSFTGYRPEKIALSISGETVSAGEVRQALREIIRRLFADGYRVFLSGMAYGFDLMAAETVLSLKEELSGIKLVAVFPHAGQRNSLPLKHVTANADHVICISEYYHGGCFHRRNDYLIENCSLMVCFYDGQPGGTHYTVKNARRRGLPIINVLNELNYGTHCKTVDGADR